METKDTVMTGKQIDAEMDRIEKLDTSYTTAEFELCKAQAEISFKAGVDEVVEWVNEHSRMSYERGKGEVAFSHTQWHIKLKEWGL